MINKYSNETNDFVKGLEALNDLYHLCDNKISPVLNRAQFHFERMQDELLKSSTPNIEKPVGRFLKNSIREMLMAFFEKNVEIKETHLLFDFSEFEMNNWNRLLDVMPSYLKLIELLGPEEYFEFQVSGKKVTVSFPVQQISEQLRIRQEVYKLYRKIFSSESLVVFQLEEKCFSKQCYTSDEDKRVFINLTLDLSFDKSSIYWYYFDEINLVLGLPNFFSNYVVRDRTKLPQDEHVVLEISDSLCLVRHKKIPENYLNNYNKEILHFRFLFRPLSIIINGSGNFLPDAYGIGNRDHGRLVSGVNNSNVLDQNRLYHALDFFSLIA